MVPVPPLEVPRVLFIKTQLTGRGPDQYEVELYTVSPVVCIKQQNTQYCATRAAAAARAAMGVAAQGRQAAYGARPTESRKLIHGGGGVHNGRVASVSERDGRRDGGGVVRKARAGRCARRAIARRVVRGGGLGLLGEHEQHAYRVVGECAGGLRDEEGAGGAARRLGVSGGADRGVECLGLALAGQHARHREEEQQRGEATAGRSDST